MRHSLLLGRRRVAVVAWVVLAWVILGAAAGARRGGHAAGVETGAGKALFQRLIVGTRRVTFEVPSAGVAPFDTLERIFGVRVGARVGDTPPHLCFQLRDEDPMRLVFAADDEGGDALAEFMIAPAGTAPEMEDRCLPLAVRSSQIATDTGLRLGLTRPELDTLLGTAADSVEDAVIYRSVVHRVVSLSPGETDSYDLTFEITATFADGRVVALQGDVGDAS